jgi:predicted transcriptional regulator of viral defense system
MNIIELKKIKKLYFGFEDISRVLEISPASAKVTASRYTRQGILLRLKRNMYVLRDAWDLAGREEKLRLANMGQVPSYLSLMTALDYYDITTQVQRDFFESVALKRSKEIHMNGSVFRYVKIAGNLYNTFKKERDLFIATPEKALLDAFYLMSYGRYSLDLSSLDETKLDRKEIERLSCQFPLKTKKMLKKNGYL